jgi:DNA-binding NarL/FixJ family response regulator
LERGSVSSAARTAVLFDPYPMWLEAVERVLEKIGVSVVGKTTDPDAVVELVERAKPDLLVAETGGDGRVGGIGAVRRARAAAPGLRIVALSSSAQPDEIDAALEAGASAYVVKTTQPDDLASAVRQTFSTSMFFPGMRGTARPPAKTPPEAKSLTRRELEILRLVAEGGTNARIARSLWVTEQTVKFHLSNIYRKLGVANRTEASRWAQLHGLLAGDREPVAR